VLDPLTREEQVELTPKKKRKNMNVIHQPLDGPKKYEVTFVNVKDKNELLERIGKKPSLMNHCFNDDWEVSYCVTKESMSAIIHLSGVDCKKLVPAPSRYESDCVLDSFYNLTVIIFPSLARDELESLNHEIDMLKNSV